MTKETYIKMTQPFRDRSKLAKSLHIANKLISGCIFLSYPLLLLCLFFQKSPFLIKAILIPLDGFILVTVFRGLISRKRPYEKFGVLPVIPKDTKGKSFPSRHVFSAAVIALTFLQLPQAAWIGILFFVFSVILAGIRVVSGVHYISDVLAALVWAGVVAAIGFYLF